jgi:hypothetical protein
VGVQAVMNLMVVTGMAPTKGIALPLLSNGGTGWILTAFSLGLVISIDRTQERVSESGEMTAEFRRVDIVSAAPAPMMAVEQPVMATASQREVAAVPAV